MLFSKEFYGKVETLFSRYPRKVNALLPILHLVQEEKGYISAESMGEVGELCEVARSHVEGVVTFYTMYKQEPIGKRKFHVCTNLSCLMRGGEEVLEHLEEKFGVHPGESTEDGKYFLEEVECLGACGYAPVMIVDDEYHENLTTEKVDQILAKIEKEPN